MNASQLRVDVLDALSCYVDDLRAEWTHEAFDAFMSEGNRSELASAISDALLMRLDDIVTLSPRPMSTMNLDANVRHLIAGIALEVIFGGAA